MGHPVYFYIFCKIPSIRTYHLSIFDCLFRNYKQLKIDILVILTAICAKTVGYREKRIPHAYLSFWRPTLQWLQKWYQGWFQIWHIGGCQNIMSHPWYRFCNQCLRKLRQEWGILFSLYLTVLAQLAVKMTKMSFFNCL